MTKCLEIPVFLWNEILKSWLRSDMARITALSLNIIQELPCYHKCSNCMFGSLKYISCSLHGLIHISRSGWISASSNSSGTYIFSNSRLHGFSQEMGTIKRQLHMGFLWLSRGGTHHFCLCFIRHNFSTWPQTNKGDYEMPSRWDPEEGGTQSLGKRALSATMLDVCFFIKMAGIAIS